MTKEKRKPSDHPKVAGKKLGRKEYEAQLADLAGGAGGHAGMGQGYWREGLHRVRRS